MPKAIDEAAAPWQSFKMRMLARVVTYLLAISLIGGCAETPTVRLSSLKTPQSVADVLMNIKLVTEAGLILRDDFYTEENLRHVFGGTIVEIRPVPERRIINGQIKGFASGIEARRSKSGSDVTLDFRIHKEIRSDGKPQAWIVFGSVTGTYLEFATIETLFGRSWVKAPQIYISPHGPIRQPATRPHGNEEIIYTLGDRLLNRTLWIGFGPDAAFEYARAEADWQGN